jgi:HlyD family secretion protein
MDRRIAKPRWHRYRRWGIPSAGLIAATVFAAIFYVNTTSRTVRIPRASITIAAVESSVYRDAIPLRGRVVPRDTIFLDALEGGRVGRVMIESGDPVKIGQPLIELSNTELELDVLDREGRLVESITQLQSYQTQLEQNRLANAKALAAIDYDIVRLRRAIARRAQLVQSGIVAREVNDTLQDELDHALITRPIQAASNAQQERLRTEQLPHIRAQIAKLRQDVEITRSKLENLTVRSPVNGHMIAIDLKVGENRNRGERLGELASDTGYKVSADVDEFYLRRLRKDQTATVRVGDKDTGLRVIRIYPHVNNGTFAVDLAFEGATPEGLFAGQAVQGTLLFGGDTPALTLPAGAFLERTGGNWAFVLDANGTSARRRPLTIGRRNTEQVEVLSGVRPGDRVITSDYAGWDRIDRVVLTD